jgi:hypothetical protein
MQVTPLTVERHDLDCRAHAGSSLGEQMKKLNVTVGTAVGESVGPFVGGCVGVALGTSETRLAVGGRVMDATGLAVGTSGCIMPLGDVVDKGMAVGVID